MPLVDVVRFVTDLVEQTSVHYVIIGGIAVSAQAEPRATKDVDLVLVLSPDEAEGFLEEIERRGLAISRKSQVLEKLRAGKPAKILWDRKFSFDLRLANYTIDHQAMARATGITLEKYDVTLRIASPEDLVVYKLARFEDIDKRDIKQIIKHNADLEWDYVSEQASILTNEYAKPAIMDHLDEAEMWYRAMPR